MNWEQATRQRLRDDAAVAALVAGRIDWGERPQGSPLPALVLRLTSDSQPQHMKGFIGFRESRVQLLAVADDHATALAIVEAAIAALAQAGSFSGVRFGRAFFELGRDASVTTDTGTLHGRSIDALIWHA